YHNLSIGSIFTARFSRDNLVGFMQPNAVTHPKKTHQDNVYGCTFLSFIEQ
ncbi:MAG: hypothetical protein ACI9X0_000981, partial [Kiritimatiellia bacterium]